MKIFLNTDDLDLPMQYNEIGIIDGIWSNKSITSEELVAGKDSLTKSLKNIKLPYIVKSDSFQMEDIMDYSKELAKLGNNVIVEYNFTKEVLKAHQYLKRIGVELNINNISSISQAILSAKAGIQFITINLEDNLELIENIIDIFDVYGFRTEIIVNGVTQSSEIDYLSSIGIDTVIVTAELLDKLLEN